jgi:hypothetical protein
LVELRQYLSFSGWGWLTATVQFAGLPFWDGYQGGALIHLILPELEIKKHLPI